MRRKQNQLFTTSQSPLGQLSLIQYVSLELFTEIEKIATDYATNLLIVNKV